MKIKKYISNKKEVLKDGNYEDIINTSINEIAIILAVIFSLMYSINMLSSLRNIVSDTIALSSIILGILGVLLGLLINLKEDSPFFKKAEAINKEEFYFYSIIVELKNSFITNLLFVIYTLFFNIIPASDKNIMKFLLLAIWSYMFIKIIWKVLYLIIIITKVATYTKKESSAKEKKK